MDWHARILVVGSDADERSRAARELEGALRQSTIAEQTALGAEGPEAADLVVAARGASWPAAVNELRALKTRQADLAIILVAAREPEGATAAALEAGLDDCVIRANGQDSRLPFAARAALRNAQARRHLREQQEEIDRLRRQVGLDATRATFIMEASAMLAASLDYEATLDHVARLAVPTLADWAGIDMLLDDGSVRQLAVAHEDLERVTLALDLRERYPPTAPESAILTVLRTGKSLFVPYIDDQMLRDAAQDAAHLALLRGLGFRSIMAVPIHARGRTLGVMSLANSSARPHFSTEDLAIAEQLGGRAGVAVDNARLFRAAETARREAQEARESAERLQAVTAALSSAVTPPMVARAIVEDGMATLAVDACSVWALDESSDEFVLLGYTGYAQETEQQHTRVPAQHAGPLTDAAEARQLIAVETPEELVARWPYLAEAQAASGDAATIAVPLMLNDHLLGVLYLAFRRPRRFSEQERTFLTTLARQCAQALERARLYELERIAREQQRFLAEASSALADSLDYTATLQNAARLAVPGFADWCSIYEMTEGGQLRREALAHVNPAAENLLREALDYTLYLEMDVPLARVIKTGEPELNPNVQDLPAELFGGEEAARRALSHRPHSSLIVPLPARERNVGAIAFFRNDPVRPFTAADRALAEEFGRRAGLAIDNSRLYREAREAVRVRDQFLVIASHELKTPLTALLGNAQLLQRRTRREGTLQERDRQTLAVVVDQAMRQRRLVDDLLDLSRLQSGKLTIEQAVVDLAQLTRQVVDDERLLEEHTNLVCEMPDEPVPVRGDELRLRQVLHNLIQNAAKYSPPHSTVTVKLARRGDMVELCVLDQGIGIPAQALPRLFGRFYRAPNAEPMSVSGLGIGLYVVREIVGLHGGGVTVESVEGQGSTFCVRLPLLGASEPG